MSRWTAARLTIVAMLLFGGLVVVATPARGSTPHHVYLPVVQYASTPAGCQAISGQSYGSLSVNPPPSNPPAAVNPDINLQIRGWASTSATLGLVTYNGVPDSNAPQLSGLFASRQLPVFDAAYQVYDWDWSTNTRGGLITTWPVTLLGMQTQPGEEIDAPPSGYDLGQGYRALVLYATQDQITLKYTRDDNVVYGYTIHVENVCVEPSLLALYQQLDSEGRANLPALFGDQPFGRANGTEIDVAIRDSGSFMDPRSQRDWWQGF